MQRLPEFLKNELSAQYTQSEITEILQGYGADRPVSFRANRLRTDRETVVNELSKVGINITPVPWYRDAFTTTATEEDLRQTKLYEDGAIYLQSLSSMLPPLILDAEAGESILDMTAAPGGKTTQIAALTDGKALITACEKDGGRFSRLAYNVKKQGAPRVTLLHTDALRLDDFFRFDRILLDAPCSGSGTINFQSKINVTEKMLSACVKVQSELAKKAWKLLKKGGTLVYSTCSILKKENDDVLKILLANPDAELLPLNLPEEIPVFPRNDFAACVRPNDLFEGFFVAKLCKH